MKNRKLILAAALIAALALTLTGCMSDGNTGVQTAPTARADYNPGNGANNGNAANNGGANNGSAMGDTGIGNDASGLTGGAGANNNGGAGNTASQSGGALGAFDWANGAAQIEQAIDRISEIADSRVVVTNSTALVGVKFDGAYKGQMTERIREMVAAEVMKADPSIQTVAVTSETEDVSKVYALSDQIRAGRTADELSADINAIVRNATTLR